MNTLQPWQSAGDPEGRMEDMLKAQYFGCKCIWKYNREGRGSMDIAEDRAECPYHKVMY